MDNKKIVWLASYPKSGNTWFRAFLTALLNEGEVDINNLKIDAIFSGRNLFDEYTDLDSRYLYDAEAKNLLPEVYSSFAKDSKTINYIKVHDAFAYNNKGRSIIPIEATKCAIYFIRNPLDIAGSLANHNGSSIDKAINLMNDSKGAFAPQTGNLNINNQFRQLMFNWSEHVKSWTSVKDFLVITVRYEDMLSDPFTTFKSLLPHITFSSYSDEDILKAIKASSFNELKQQEKNKGGFKEANPRSQQFFRGGKKENWKKELTKAQIDKILISHQEIMNKYQYTDNSIYRYYDDAG